MVAVNKNIQNLSTKLQLNDKETARGIIRIFSVCCYETGMFHPSKLSNQSF